MNLLSVPRIILLYIWKNKWVIFPTILVIYLLLREFSPPGYIVINNNVPVMHTERAYDDPINVFLTRCNYTSKVVIFHYIRRLEGPGGEVWPLEEGNAPIDPGCRTGWIEVGEVPRQLPEGRWRVRSDNVSVNWLYKAHGTGWVSDSFDVVSSK